ncbi:MAG TPA: hypothetical protein VGL77_02070 [Armatimonadota bacterium]|jgi:hypothetical protein
MNTHDHISFRSPLSGIIVNGIVHTEHDTYVTACWQEAGSKYATALCKKCILENYGSNLTPVLTVIPSPVMSNGTLSLFDMPDVMPVTAVPLAVAVAVPVPVASIDDSLNGTSIAYSLADILWCGERVCRLRNVTGQAAWSWRTAGFAVRGLG